MQRIVTDEQRSDQPKSARRRAVAAGCPSDGVASLVRATSPVYTMLLAEKQSATITVDQCHVIWLKRRQLAGASWMIAFGPHHIFRGNRT
ncbi:MAG: hypothetical protein R3E02_04980 [Blastomonas sp.]